MQISQVRNDHAITLNNENIDLKYAEKHKMRNLIPINWYFL